MDERREEIWMYLASLFFLADLPASDEDVQRAAQLLRSVGWSKEQAERALLTVVAPHAKRYLGYGLPLALGEERESLGPDDLLPKMRRSDSIRSKRNSGIYFFFQDWLNRRVLKRVRVDRLLDLL